MNWLFPKKAIEQQANSSFSVRRLLPGALAALLVASGSALGILKPLEQIAYTVLFRLRGSLPWDERVVVVAIDEPSIQELGRFPWKRQRYATLLNVLFEAKPSVVVFDILFSESSPEDEELAEAIAKHQGQLVMALAWNSSGEPLKPVGILEKAANPPSQEGARPVGHINTHRNADGVPRSIDPQINGIPALGISTVQIYSLVREQVSLPDLNRPLWINWPGRTSEAKEYSFVEVIRGQVPTSAFKDKIVLIGTTATGLDPLSTPFDRNPPAGGVYLHAAVINNLLHQNFLRKPDDFWQLLLILPLGGPLLSFIVIRQSMTVQLVIFGTTCATWAILSFLLFRAGCLVLVASPIVLFSLTCIPIVVYKLLKMEVANRELHHQATTDGLTQLSNRRWFDEYLDREWRRLAREQLPLSLILCDVDFFKKYNDRYGHQAGDDCLRQVAGALQGVVRRPADLAARYGGEEFALILPNTPEQGAMYIAEAARQAVKALKIPHAESQVSECISLSLGVVSMIPDRNTDPAKLIAAADKALYQAKAEGRDRVVHAR